MHFLKLFFCFYPIFLLFSITHGTYTHSSHSFPSEKKDKKVKRLLPRKISAAKKFKKAKKNTLISHEEYNKNLHPNLSLNPQNFSEIKNLYEKFESYYNPNADNEKLLQFKITPHAELTKQILETKGSVKGLKKTLKDISHKDIPSIKGEILFNF